MSIATDNKLEALTKRVDELLAHVQMLEVQVANLVLAQPKQQDQRNGNRR